MGTGKRMDGRGRRRALRCSPRSRGGGLVIAVVGEALIDAHRDGDLLRLFPGGGPFNTAIALRRLGAPACYLGAISQDWLGRQLEQTLRSAGVDTSRVVHVDAPTPIAIVDPTPVEPSYSF